jgi:hypothetical protein
MTITLNGKDYTLKDRISLGTLIEGRKITSKLNTYLIPLLESDASDEKGVVQNLEGLTVEWGKFLDLAFEGNTREVKNIVNLSCAEMLEAVKSFYVVAAGNPKKQNAT